MQFAPLPPAKQGIADVRQATAERSRIFEETLEEVAYSLYQAGRRGSCDVSWEDWLAVVPVETCKHCGHMGDWRDNYRHRARALLSPIERIL